MGDFLAVHHVDRAAAEHAEVPTSATEDALPRRGPGEGGAGFDPWRGDTVPPVAAPAEWAASAAETFDIPPTPPPLSAEEIAAAMTPAAEPFDLEVDVDMELSSEPAPAPVPSWRQSAVDEVSDLGPRLRSVGGSSRIDTLAGRAAEPDRTAAWPARIDERVIKQSVRFGDEPMPSPKATPAPSGHAADSAPGKVLDPWDEVGGPGGALDLDLDQIEVVPSPLDDVLGHVKTPGGFSTASLDLVTASAPEDECTALMRGARELFELGDFSGSLDLIEKVLKIEPDHEGARAYLQRNESTLIKMYESKLGDMRRTPKQLMPPDEVIWMNMHHRAGFLLSQVDGMLSYEDLLEVSGMPRFDTMRILHELVQQGIIG